MYLDLPELERGTTKLDVKIIGFQNPNFVNTANRQGAIQVSVLGGSVARTEIRAQAFSTFKVDLHPYDFKQISLFSTTPWSGEQTSLELDWSMTNKINQEEVYQVEVELPSDFRVSTSILKCQNLFNKDSVPCTFTEDNKIVVGLKQSRSTSSQLSYTSVGLKIGPIWNPNRLVEAEPVQLRVL